MVVLFVRLYQQHQNVDGIVQSKRKKFFFCLYINTTLFFQAAVQHLRHLVHQFHGHTVVVQEKVQNHLSFVKTIFNVHHLHLVNQVHQQNVVVTKRAVILVDIFVRFVHAMWKALNAYMVCSIIVIISCM